MKKLIALFLSVLTLAGCSTTPKSPSATVLIKSVSRTATAIHIQDNPQHREAFVRVVAGINILIEGGEIDPAELRELIQLEDPKVALVLLAAVDLYDAYVKELVGQQLNDWEHLRPALVAFRDGIQQGLDITE